MLGFPLADPIIGIIISAAIIVLLGGTITSIGRRLMDGIEPDLVDRARHATLVLADTTLSAAERVAHAAEHNITHDVPKS